MHRGDVLPLRPEPQPRQEERDAGQAIQAGSSAFTFAYNDQIKSVRNGPNSATYLYDGNGQRVQKTVDGVVSKFLWAGSEIIKEYTAGGQVKAQYLLGAERTAIKTNGRWNFYLSDGLGSTVMLTDYRGRPVATWDYDDFGETTQLSPGTMTTSARPPNSQAPPASTTPSSTPARSWTRKPASTTSAPATTPRRWANS